MAVAEIADLERRRLLSHAAIRSPGRSLGGTGFHRLHAEHQRDDSVFASSGGVRDADETPSRKTVARSQSAATSAMR